MIIDSHTGPYSAAFDTDAIENLNAEIPANAHFLIDRHVAELYADAIQAELAGRIGFED